MEARFTAAAEAELQEARRYYAALNPALAGLFHAEAETAVRRILAHPRAWPLERGEIRRFLLNRFNMEWHRPLDLVRQRLLPAATIVTLRA